MDGFIAVFPHQSGLQWSKTGRDRARRIEQLFADDQRPGKTSVDEEVGTALSEVEVQPRLVEFIQKPVRG